MTTKCPFAAWRPITANFKQGGRQPIRGFVPHVQVGTGSLWAFFNRPKPPGEGASSDFWCSKLGVLEQYVDLADQAWAQGSRQHNGNPTFVSCEFEGMPDEPMTPAQIAKGGLLIAWLRAEVNDFPLQVNHDPDNGYGVTPHHVFGGGHTCPGPGPREAQFPDLIAAAQPHPHTPEDDTMNFLLVMHVTGDKTDGNGQYTPVDGKVYAANPASEPIHADNLTEIEIVLEAAGHKIIEANPNYTQHAGPDAGGREYKCWPLHDGGAAKFRLPTAV